jgi:pentatricopeptide repeat protein
LCRSSKKIFENISEPDQIGYAAMSFVYFFFSLKKTKIVCLFFLLVNTYGLNGMATQAIELFRQVPDKFLQESTYVCVLSACSHSGFVNEAHSIFENIQIKSEKIYCTMVY